MQGTLLCSECDYSMFGAGALRGERYALFAHGARGVSAALQPNDFVRSTAPDEGPLRWG